VLLPGADCFDTYAWRTPPNPQSHPGCPQPNRNSNAAHHSDHCRAISHAQSANAHLHHHAHRQRHLHSHTYRHSQLHPLPSHQQYIYTPAPNIHLYPDPANFYRNREQNGPASQPNFYTFGHRYRQPNLDTGQ